MKKARTAAACLAGRAASLFCRLTGHGGTSLPGSLALRVCPDLLKRLSEGVRVVLVTGTNGKTTTTRMLEAMCLSQGLRSFSNPSGANLRSGLVSAFLAHSGPAGRRKADLAILEVDEAVLPTVAGDLSPAAVIVTNVFRDQLDRFGEVSGTVSLIRKGLERAPGALLCLNADCMLTLSAAEGLKNPRILYGIDAPLPGAARDISDLPRCLSCGGPLTYAFHTYGHLGAFSCPRCGASRPAPQVAVTEVSSLEKDASFVTFRLEGKPLPARIGVPAVYNIYNAAAALSGAMALGLDRGAAAETLAETGPGFGRMETLYPKGKEVRIILAKNPAGMNRSLDYLASLEEPFLALFCLNDHVNDGTDVSWIWDADFEPLAGALEKTGSRAAAAGTRAGDMALRLKYAGLAEEEISAAGTWKEAEGLVLASPLPVCVIANYTAMLEIRDRLALLSGRGRFWEEKGGQPWT